MTTMAVLSMLVALAGIVAGMEVGSERLFEGTAQFAVSSDTHFGASHYMGRRRQVQLREVVIGRDEKGFRLLHFRRVQEEGDLVRFAVVPKEHLVTEVSPLLDNPIPFLPLHLWLTTPPLRRVGQSWENKADGQVWWFFPTPLPTRYRVVAAETVNGRACWVVERTLSSPAGLMRLERYRERWWLTKTDGATVRYTLDMAMRQPLPLGGSYSLELQLDLRLRQESQLAKGALAKLQRAEERLANWQRRWTQAQRLPPESDAAWKAMEEVVREWRAWRGEEKDEWLISCALMPWWQQMITARQRLMEARTQKGNLLPAPDFALTDTDGRVHRLSDLRGNFVILNFFGVG